MGVNSKHLRFREAGEQTNVNNVERFGEPVRSLFTTTKVLNLHHHIDVVDANDQVVYQANSKMISLHDKTTITDAAGNQVAHVERKILSMHERHFVTMTDGTKFELSNEILHIVKDITNIEGLGWQLTGNIMALNFEIYDGDGSIIAVIGQKLVSLHDKYCIDIYKPELEAKAVTVLITLQHMINDREKTIVAGS